jgi:hypothetical protein
MKPAILLFSLIGLFGVIASAFGATQLYAVIPHYELLSRLLAGLCGLVALIAAYGCWRRKMFGWYFGGAFIWLCILCGVFRAAYLAYTLDLPWLGTLLGGLGEALKIVAFAWFTLRFWRSLRPEFKQPNQPLQATPTAVTPAAGAPGAPAAGVPEL